MPTTPHLAAVIPNLWSGRVPQIQELVAYCRAAEDLGFHSLWLTDRVFHQRVRTPHQLTLLTYAAASTSRIQLGTAVLLLSLRHPVEVAQQAATLDALAGGRLVLGVGMGGRDDEFQAMSMPKRQRPGRLEEGVALLRRLWTGEAITYHGRYYHVEEARLPLKPAQEKGIPIPIGGMAELALRRAGRIGDGWLMGGRGGGERFAWGWNMVCEAAREAGRDPSSLMNGKLLYANLDDDKERARRELQTYLDAYYGPEVSAQQFTAAGGPQDLAARIRELGDAGCQIVMLSLPWPDVAKLRRIAEEVTPLLG